MTNVKMPADEAGKVEADNYLSLQSRKEELREALAMLRKLRRAIASANMKAGL